MPTPAADSRYVRLTKSEEDRAQVAISGLPDTYDGFTRESDVRDKVSLFRALARAPISPRLAAAIIATTDRLLGSSASHNHVATEAA